MLTKIKADMTQTLIDRDGATIPEIVELLATSALASLATPSDAMKRAGCARLARQNIVVSYEQMEAAFVEMINAAAKP